MKNKADSMRGVVNYHAVNENNDYSMSVDNENNEVLPDVDTTEVALHDPRDGEELKFSKCGLEYSHYPSEVREYADFLEENDKIIYFQEIEMLLKMKLDDVEEVFVFDYTIRSNKRVNRKPARHVHVDYTEHSAEKRMRVMIGDERAEDWMKDGGHYGIVNVWRPLDYPVEKDPLGFIDPASTTPEDWHVLKIGRSDRVGVIYGVEYRMNHRWLVLDKMEPAMVWIFNQFDSHGLPGVPHSAVSLVGEDHQARVRRSIECRVLVRYHH